jgi:hypothetical protein
MKRLDWLGGDIHGGREVKWKGTLVVNSGVRTKSTKRGPKSRTRGGSSKYCTAKHKRSGRFVHHSRRDNARGPCAR